MKTIAVTLATFLFVASYYGCRGQRFTPRNNADPRSIQIIQDQLQQLLDEEARLQASRQSLLQKLRESGFSQIESNPNPGSLTPTNAGSSPGGTTPTVTSEAKLNSIVNQGEVSVRQASKPPNFNSPFPEVYVESAGIQVLNNNPTPNRRILQS